MRSSSWARVSQWVVTIPERLSEAGYIALESFVVLAASCMGIEPVANSAS